MKQFEIPHRDNKVVLLPRLQPCKIVQTQRLQKYTRFLVLCFYWIEFYNCFNLVLLLAVPFLVYINLVDPIIRATRYCLERRTPTVFPQRGRLVEWFSISHRCSNSLKETCACASIGRVFMGPSKLPYTILFSLNYTGKKTKKNDESVAAALRKLAQAIDFWLELRVAWLRVIM